MPKKLEGGRRIERQVELSLTQTANLLQTIDDDRDAEEFASKWLARLPNDLFEDMTKFIRNELKNNSFLEAEFDNETENAFKSAAASSASNLPSYVGSSRVQTAIGAQIEDLKKNSVSVIILFSNCIQNAACNTLELLDRSVLFSQPNSALRHCQEGTSRNDAEGTVANVGAIDSEHAVNFADVEWRAFIEDEAIDQTEELRTVVMVPSLELGSNIRIPEFFVLLDGQPFDALVTQMADKVGIVFDGIYPILAYLSVTLEDGSVMVNFRTAELAEKELT
jgi:hypothetical protein